MKSILIICTLGIIVSFTLEASAQSNLGKLRRVERLEKEKSELEKSIQEKEKEIEEQKEHVKAAAKKVEEEENRQKKIGEQNPKSHGTMTELNDRRENLKKEEAKQKELEDELKDLKEKKKALQEKLDKAEAELEKALQDAENDVFKKRPLPEDPEELKKYKDEIDGWDNDGWNNDFGRKLKKRLKDKISGILTPQDESSATPSPNKQYFEPKGRLNAGWEPVKKERAVFILSGAALYNYTSTGLSEGDFQNFQQEVYADPRKFSELMEELGGEFAFGSFSELASLQYSSESPELRLALELATTFKNSFALAMGMEYAQKTIRANFPLMVFGTDSGNIQTARGEVNQTVQNIYLQPSLAWIPGTGMVKPNIAVGPTILIKAENASFAKIGSWDQKISKGRSMVEIGARLRAGVHLELNDHFILQATANVTFHSSGWQKGLQMMAGFRF